MLIFFTTSRETRMLKAIGTRSSSIGTPSVWFTARTKQLERELELHLRAQRRCLKKIGAIRSSFIQYNARQLEETKIR